MRFDTSAKEPLARHAHGKTLDFRPQAGQYTARGAAFAGVSFISSWSFARAYSSASLRWVMSQ